MGPLTVAQTLTVYQVLSWATYGILLASIILLFVDILRREDFTKPNSLLTTVIILMVIFPVVAIGAGEVHLSIPECPICETTVTADVCSDCGWESMGVVFDVHPLEIAPLLVLELVLVFIAWSGIKAERSNRKKTDSSGEGCSEEVVVVQE